MKKVFLIVMSAVIIFSAGIANAAWTSLITTTTEILPNAYSTTLAAGTTVADVMYTLGTGEQLVTNDTVTLTLSGGATWAVVPTITVINNHADSWAVFSVVGNPVGGTTANFTLAGRITIGNGLNIATSTVNALNYTAVTASMDLTLGATQTSAGSLVIINNASLTTASTRAVATRGTTNGTATVTTQACVADVSATTGAYTKFTGAGTTNATCTGGGALGLQIATLNNAKYYPSGKAFPLNKVLYTLAGDFTGITTVTAAAGVTSSDSTGGVTGTTGATFAINAGKTAAYAVNVAAIAGAGGLLDAVPVFTVNGTSAQTARVFTGAISLLTDSATWTAASLQAATTLWTITRNGSFFVSNSIGAINSIKITDRSGALPTAGGTIIVTAYDAAGNLLAEAAGVTALMVNNNATTTIAGADLAARFVGTAMKYEFAVESSNMVATSVKTNSDGSKSSTVYQSSGTGGAL